MPVDPSRALVVGVDYGTLSGRAVVVRVADGAQLGTAVHEYRHAVLTDALPDGTPLGPDWALQVPSDYVEVLRTAVPAAVEEAGIDPGHVIGIATDFTACTMVPTLADGTPLNEVDGLADRPHAYVATHPVVPLGPPVPVDDLVGLHAAHGIELLVLPELEEHFADVRERGREFSGIRLGNSGIGPAGPFPTRR